MTRQAAGGSIHPNNTGYRWHIWRDGRLVSSRTWPTEDEARAELAAVKADPNYTPAPKGRPGGHPRRKTTSGV